MVDKIKVASSNTKRAIEKAYEVLAMGAAVAAACSVANNPHVSGLPVWQVVAGVLLAGVAYRVFSLLNKES